MLTFALAAVCIGQATASVSADQKLLISRLPTSVFTTGEKKLFIARRRYAEQVETMLIEDGHLSPSIRVAVLANAWHECKFDPNMSHIDSNGKNTAGFFALNSGGVGKGMTVSQKRHIPTAYNRLFGRTATKEWLQRVVKKEWSAADAAYNYAAKVMVCAISYKGRPLRSERRHTAAKWEAALKKVGVL